LIQSKSEVKKGDSHLPLLTFCIVVQPAAVSTLLTDSSVRLPPGYQVDRVVAAAASAVGVRAVWNIGDRYKKFKGRPG